SKVERCGSNARSSLSSSIAAAGRASCGAGELEAASAGSGAARAFAPGLAVAGVGLSGASSLKSRSNLGMDSGSKENVSYVLAGAGGGGCRKSRAAGFGNQWIGGIELAAERHRFLPRFASSAGHRIQLARDGFECRRLVVLRVNFEKLEINLLALRIFFQRILENFFRFRIATIREIDLDLGDGVDFVGIDVAEPFAA